MNSILSNNSIFVKRSTPQVGINDESPNFTLDVTGTINVSGQANLNNVYCQTINGYNWNGRQGIIGIQSFGFQGYQGSTNVLVQGNQGNQGLISFISIPGIQGFIGSDISKFQGFLGIQEFLGNQGNQGNQGENYTGIQGFQGFQGFQALRGFQGFQAFQGSQGFQASEGFQGFQGANITKYRLTLISNVSLSTPSSEGTFVTINWTNIGSITNVVYNEIPWSGSVITAPISGMYLITFYSRNLNSINGKFMINLSGTSIQTYTTGPISSGTSSIFGNHPYTATWLLPMNISTTVSVRACSSALNQVFIDSNNPAFLTVELI